MDSHSRLTTSGSISLAASLTDKNVLFIIPENMSGIAIENEELITTMSYKS